MPQTTMPPFSTDAPHNRGLHLLLSTLELEPLLHHFANWTHSQVGFSTMLYQHEGIEAITIAMDGATNGHHAVVTHRLPGLGGLSFSRETPFIPQERAMLSSLTRKLSLPLRNALRYHEAQRHALTLDRRLRLAEHSCASLCNIAQEPDQQATTAAHHELHHALQQGALTLHYQPKVDLLSGEVRGLEALLRWHHPDKGLLSPERFIGNAEQSGLITHISRWVLTMVMRQCAHWQRQGILVPVAINLSALDLADPTLPDFLAQLLTTWRVPAAMIELEITETAAIQGQQREIETLERMRSLGVTVALDDFGIGYSSLQRLKHFPIDTIKIDKSFVMQEGRSHHDAHFVDTITRLGHRLGMKVVAEGVDCRESWQRLLHSGCDMVQGYHICRPLPSEAVTHWLRRAIRPPGDTLH